MTQHTEQLLQLVQKSLHDVTTPLAAIKLGASGIEDHLYRLIEAYQVAKLNNLSVPEIKSSHLSDLNSIVKGIQDQSKLLAEILWPLKPKIEFGLQAMTAVTSEILIRQYDLKPHPEGGYFKQTYCSQGIIENLNRHHSTAIYFLLPQGAKSKLHRIRSDELWHFYLGSPVTIVQIYPDGKVEEIKLGQNIAEGQRVQYVVPSGCWFGAYPSGGFSFVGCTVAPGFDFEDFELGKQEALIAEFPHAKEVINLLTE